MRLDNFDMCVKYFLKVFLKFQKHKTQTLKMNVKSTYLNVKLIKTLKR